MLRPWGEWESLSRALGGVGHAVRACGSLQHAFRLQESGRLDEALAEAKSVLSLVRKSRRGSVTRGSGTGGSAARLSGGGKGSEILVLGALVIDELATAIGRPHQARSALEEALLVIEEERDAPRATDVEAHRYPFEAFETFLRSRLFELRALGQAKLN